MYLKSNWTAFKIKTFVYASLAVKANLKYSDFLAHTEDLLIKKIIC